MTESIIEIDYEISAFRFQFVNNEQFILEDGNLQIAINCADLEKYGYHAVGEPKWYKNKSGSVLVFFFLDNVNYFSREKEDYNAPIFAEFNIEPEMLLSNSQENLVCFSVLDVQLVGIYYWERIRFDYHEEVPCEGTKLIPEPTIHYPTGTE